MVIALSYFYVYFYRFLLLCQYVVWRAMIALNNIIARAKSLHVRYLIEKGILLLVLPFVHSLSTRLRLQALWIVGNLGTLDGPEGFKSAVLATDAVATIVQVIY